MGCHCSEADVLRALNVQMLRFQVTGRPIRLYCVWAVYLRSARSTGHSDQHAPIHLVPALHAPLRVCRAMRRRRKTCRIWWRTLWPTQVRATCAASLGRIARHCGFHAGVERRTGELFSKEIRSQMAKVWSAPPGPLINRFISSGRAVTSPAVVDPREP